jgi:ATP-dependent RNA helicase DHX37/DHR1
MRKELVPNDEAPMSSKKRKRLDAYIAKKLKQEEMHESLRIIAANALAVPSAPQSSAGANALSTLGIKSTKTLGQFPFNPLSAMELADRKEDLVVRKAMTGVPGGDQRRKGRRARAGAYENLDGAGDEDSEEGDEDITDGEPIVEDERAIKKRKKAERNGIVVSAGASGDAANLSTTKKPKKASAASKSQKV